MTHAGTAVTGAIARPEQVPESLRHRRQQRLRGRHTRQIRPEIHNQQPIVVRLGDPAKRQRLRAEHGSVDRPTFLPGEHRIFSPQAQQIAMKPVDSLWAPKVIRHGGAEIRPA